MVFDDGANVGVVVPEATGDKHPAPRLNELIELEEIPETFVGERRRLHDLGATHTSGDLHGIRDIH